MTFENETFRRFEAMLLAAGLPAELPCTLIALALEAGIAEPSTSEIVEQEFSFSVALLADRLGLDPLTAAASIRQQIAWSTEKFGFLMASIEDADGVDPAGTVVIGRILTDIILGRVVEIVEAATDVVRPDETTRAALELIGRMTLSGGAAVLCRYHPSAGARENEMRRAADSLKMALGRQAAVLVQRDADGSAFAAVLSACLRSGPASVLCLTADCLQAASTTVVEELTALEFDDDIKEATPWRTLSPDGERVRSLIPHMPICLVLPISRHVVLRPCDASWFATAVGPLRIDRAAAAEAICSAAEFELEPGVAGRLVDLWRDEPKFAKTALDVAGRLVLSDMLGSDPDSTAARRARSDKVAFNALTTALTVGLAPHVWSPAAIVSNQPPSRFYRELLVSEPSPDLLFSPKLKEINLKILLHGEAGTGKTAIGAYISSKVFNMPCIQLRASDVLHHKLGMLEKSISQHFRNAREEGAILIIDEADSLVGDRYNANSASLHITTSLTNQFLVELDRHELPVLMLTNFADRLDPAIKRRLDLSFHIKPIPENLERRALALVLGLADPGPSFCGFGGTTVIADYDAARRLARFHGNDAGTLVAAVRRARDIRCGCEGPRRKIGF